MFQQSVSVYCGICDFHGEEVVDRQTRISPDQVVVVLLSATMIAQCRKGFVQFYIVGDYRPAIPERAEVLAGIEAESRQVPESPTRFSL